MNLSERLTRLKSLPRRNLRCPVCRILYDGDQPTCRGCWMRETEDRMRRHFIRSCIDDATGED
jgi:hypothetical protein